MVIHTRHREAEALGRYCKGITVSMTGGCIVSLCTRLHGEMVAKLYQDACQDLWKKVLVSFMHYWNWEESNDIRTTNQNS